MDHIPKCGDRVRITLCDVRRFVGTEGLVWSRGESADVVWLQVQLDGDSTRSRTIFYLDEVEAA